MLTKLYTCRRFIRLLFVVPSFCRSSLCSLVRSFLPLLIPSLLPSFFCSFIHLFIYSSIHLSIYYFGGTIYRRHSLFLIFPTDSECLVIEHNQRINCGFHGILPRQCKEKGCCFHSKVATGVPHCFLSKTQFGEINLQQIRHVTDRYSFYVNNVSNAPHCFWPGK